MAVDDVGTGTSLRIPRGVELAAGRLVGISDLRRIKRGYVSSSSRRELLKKKNAWGAVVRILSGTIYGIYGNSPDISRTSPRESRPSP